MLKNNLVLTRQHFCVDQNRCLVFTASAHPIQTSLFCCMSPSGRTRAAHWLTDHVALQQRRRAVADHWMEWEGGEALTGRAERENEAGVVDSVVESNAPNMIPARNYLAFCNVVIYSLLFIAVHVGVAQILSHPGTDTTCKNNMT